MYTYRPTVFFDCIPCWYIHTINLFPQESVWFHSSYYWYYLSLAYTLDSHQEIHIPPVQHVQCLQPAHSKVWCVIHDSSHKINTFRKAARWCHCNFILSQSATDDYCCMHICALNSTLRKVLSATRFVSTVVHIDRFSLTTVYIWLYQSATYASIHDPHTFDTRMSFCHCIRAMHQWLPYALSMTSYIGSWSFHEWCKRGIWQRQLQTWFTENIQLVWIICVSSPYYTSCSQWD